MKKFKKIGLIFLLIGAILFASCSNNSNSSSNSGNADGSPSVDTGSSGSNNQTSPTNPENPSKDDPPEETPSYVRVPQKYKEPVTGKTAAEIIEMMGAGWNLGNKLDAALAGDSGSATNPGSGEKKGLDLENDWDKMGYTTKAWIDVVAAAGFSHVRVPVSWHNHLLNSNQTSGTIDPEWLERVKEIVDWVIEDGMFCVINIHHDTWSGAGDFWGYCVDGTHESDSVAYVENIWNQVAAKFKDYDQRLVFETLNEPRIRNPKAHEWYCADYLQNNNCSVCSAAVTRVNTLNQKALDTIRAAGGNNTSRLVIVPSYVANPNYAFKDSFKMPTDSASNLLALSTHMYTPNKFAFIPDADNRTTFDSDLESDLKWHFDTLYEKFISKGIPVFIGEFSATNKNNLSERVKWAKYYVAGAYAKKMAYCLWDNNVYEGGNDASERHGHLNRENLTWYDPDIIKAITGGADLSGGSTGGSSGGGNENIPEGKTALGLTGISTEAADIYTFTNKSDTGVTITHSKPADGWKNFSVAFTAGKQNISMKIKNNGSSAADVRIDLMQGWSTDAIKSVKVDNTSKDITTETNSGTTKKYFRCSIPTNTTVSLEFTMDSTASTFACFYDSSQETGGVTTGSITISEAYMY